MKMGQTGTLDDSNIWKGTCTSLVNLKMHKDLKKWKLAGKIVNKKMKAYNGNIKSNIKIMHWNLGSRYWDKKLEDIQHLVDQYGPDYAFISEANYFHDTPANKTDIEGYDMIVAKTIKSLKFSRIVLLAKQDMQYTVESSRMEDSISSIWIKTGGKGRKSLLIGGVYRDHSIIRQQNNDNNSSDLEQQILRWKKFIAQWVKASNGNNCLIIGDTNVDTLKLDDPDQEMEVMSDLIKDEIMTRNFHQMVQGPTRFWNKVRPSLIDQIWVNDVSRVVNVSNNTRGTADHNVISVTYRLKGGITKNMETKGRDRRKFIPEEFKRRMSIMNWNEVFEEDNVDIATFKFETKFLSVLDEMAPIKKFQPRNKRSDWISDQTKELMIRRDNTRDLAVTSSLQEHWEKYRKLRNLCNSSVKTDRHSNLKSIYEKLQNENNVRGLFELTKRKMGVKKTGQPEMFIQNGKQITCPREMAGLQLKTFHEKIKKLLQELPLQVNDPLHYLNRAVRKWSKYSQVPELIIRPVGRSEVLSMIKEMNGSHAFSMDGIDTKSLKLVADAVAAPIADLINKSVSQKKFPKRWKFGKLVPLYKGGGGRINLIPCHFVQYLC